MDAEDILRESEGSYEEAKPAAVKKGITSLDLRFLVRELRQKLIGGVFRKIYQYGSSGTRQFLIDIFAPQKGGFWLYVDSGPEGGRLFITTKKKAVPQEPPNFCMFLRKHLMGKRIRDVRQHGFDRIVEITTDEHILIFELFSKGNAILCDSSYNIIMPANIQRWRHRVVRPKTPYKYPPEQVNPFELDPRRFHGVVQGSDRRTGELLAVGFGFGSVYSAEICRRAGVDGAKAGKDLTAQEAGRIYNTVMFLDKEKPIPCIYPTVVSPFRLKSLTEEPEQAESFSEALDEFFSGQDIQAAREEAEQAVEEKKGKVERIVEKVEEAKEKWTGVRDESKEKADLIYRHYGTVEWILEGIKKAKGSGLEWGAIKERIRSESTPEAESIKEIREGEGIVVVELEGKEIELDFRKSPEENAANYFEGSKFAKKKLAGAEQVAEEKKEELESIPEPDVSEVTPFIREKPAPAEKPKKPKRRWYESYKWFISSDGFIVIAGKNATQNENVIKKRTDPQDLVFHSDIQGAAFVVIKSEGRSVSDEVKKEAAEFAAANSKAWSRGLGKIDVYCAKPEQVSKTPPSGQYLPKGSFMISGEKEWFRDTEIKLAVGVQIKKEENYAKIVSGPVMAIRKLSDYFVTIRPGFKRSHELASSIRKGILMKAKPEDRLLIEAVPLDEFQKTVPSGMGEVVESAGQF